MACNSCRRFPVIFGYAILRSLSVSRTMRDTISRVFTLSSAGTEYQGAFRVLVACQQARADRHGDRQHCGHGLVASFPRNAAISLPA